MATVKWGEERLNAVQPSGLDGAQARVEEAQTRESGAQARAEEAQTRERDAQARAARLRLAWSTDPTRASDEESRAAARVLAKEALTWQAIAALPEESYGSDEEKYAAAAKMVELITGEDDWDGRLWNGGKGFKTGADYLRSVKETIERGAEGMMDPELREWSRMTDEEKDARVEEERGIASRLGEVAGVTAGEMGRLVRGVPRLTKDEYANAPENVRAASDDLGSVMADRMTDEERRGRETLIHTWRNGDWERMKRRLDYEAKLRRKNALLYLPGMIAALGTDEAKELAGELARHPERMPPNWAERLKALPVRDIETLVQVRGMTREHVEGDFLNWLGDAAIGVYNGFHGLFARGLGQQGAKHLEMAWNAFAPQDWQIDIDECARRRNALWSAYAGWDSPVESISDEHGAFANFTINLASTVPFVLSMKAKALGFGACAAEAMSAADQTARAAGLDTDDPEYAARNALMGGLYAYCLKAVSPRFFGASANGAAEEIALRTAFMKGVVSGCAKLDTLKVMSQRTASGALTMAMQQGIAAINDGLNLGGDAWKDTAERFTEAFASSIPDMLVFSAHGVLEGHAHASGGWRKAFTAEGRANRSASLRDAVAAQMALNMAVRGDGLTAKTMIQVRDGMLQNMYRAWTEGGERELRKLGLKDDQVAEAREFFEGLRERAGAARRLEEADAELARRDARLDEGAATEEFDPYEFAERNEAARERDEAARRLDETDAALRGRADALLGSMNDGRAEVGNLAAVRNVWAEGNAVGAGRTDGTDVGAAALIKAGFAPEDARSLSRAFGAERRGMYSPEAAEALRALYERSTRGRVAADAALARAFGGRVRKTGGGTFIDIPLPDGGTGTLAVETADLSRRFYGEAGSDPEMARQVEAATRGKANEVKAADWIRMSDAERREVVENPQNRLVYEGDFELVSPDDPTLSVSASGAANLVGRVTIDPTADPGAGFHEVMHGWLRFCQETGFFDEADVKWLQETYGKPGNAKEQLDEESAADGFRRYCAARAAGAAAEEAGPWRKIYALARRMMHKAERDTATGRLAANAEQALYDQILAGRYAHIRELKFAEPKEAPKAEAGGESAAPQTGAKPKAEESPAENAEAQRVVSELPHVEVPRRAASYGEARQLLKAETGKPFTNAKSGIKASLSGNSINKILSGKAVAKSVGVKQHLAAAANIVSLFEGGELRATEEGNRKGVEAAKRIFARFDLDGESLVAKITVLEHGNGDNRIYSVEAMEVAKAGSILAPKDSTSQAENPALPSTLRIIPQSGGENKGGNSPRVVSFEALTPTGGKKVKGHYEIVPLASLLHSNKPGYPMELQQRDRRDNKGEEQTREDHIANFEAGYLLADPKTDSGAMVVARRPGPDGKPQLVVVSGNGRTMVLEELANRHLYDRYRNRMKEWAAENGVENAVADADNPVLVRVVDELGGATLKELADLSNTNAIQQMNEEETARADADLVRSLDLAKLYRPNMDGSAKMAAGASDEFFRAFVRATGDTSLLNSDGTFTEALRMRARRALLAIACGQGERGRDVVKKLVEDTDALGIDRQKDAAAAIAPHVAAIESRPEYAIGPDVSRAFADYIEFRENRDTGKKWGTLENYLKQGDMLDQRSEIAESVMRLLDDPKSAPVLAETVRLYAEAAKGETDGLFGAARTRAEIWRDAAKAVDENAAQERARSEGAFKPETRFSIRSEADGKKDEEKKGVVARVQPSEQGQNRPAHLRNDTTQHTLTLESAAPVRGFGDSISQDGVKSPADFLTGLVHALGSTETNPDKTQYFDITHEDGRNLSLRVANHRATARQYTDHGNTAEVKTSVVVKMSDKPFLASDGVELTEHVYFSDKLTAEREAGIAHAVAEWIATGEWNGPAADQVNMSPRKRKPGSSAQGGRSFNGVTPEQDAAYAEAVKRGDLETARRMEREVYERMGYSDDSSYQGTSAFNGAAPSRNAYFETKAERIEATKNGEMEDTTTLGDFRDGIDVNNLQFIVFDPRSERYADPMRQEAIRNIRGVLDGGKDTITMYRSVPADVKEGQFRNGDWITPSRAYAEDNARIHGWGEKSRIIEQEVSVEDVWWDGNDIAEWGFDDGKGSVYKNTAANRKLLGPTYDDAGNLIPLSKRFNDWKNDIRYSIGGQGGAANLGLKSAADAEQMEKDGASRENIWRTTGWWRGRDGKWRVEIPDVKRKRWDGDPEERHFTGGGEDFYRYRLTELIEDGDFLKAYPAARKIKVEFHKNMPANVGGNFNEATLTIKLPLKYHLTTDWAKEGLGEGKSAELNEAGRKTIVHELQHAIQLFESFAKGGSPTEPVRPYALGGETGHALSVFGEAVGLDPTNDRHLLNIANWAQKITSDYTKGDVPQRIVESFEAAAKEAGKTPQEFRDEIERFYDSHTETPVGQYIRLEGEVEARNVQARLGMTTEERAATPPWETEDVPGDSQIVRYSIVSLAGRDVAVATDVAAMENINAKDPRSVEKYISAHLESDIEMLVGGAASITGESARHFAWSRVRELGGRQMRQARAKAATVIRDLIGMFTADDSTYENKPNKDGVAWRCRLPFGMPRLDKQRKVVGGVVYDADVVIKDDGHGKYFYDVSNLEKNETLTQQLDGQAEALIGAENTARLADGAGSASGVSTANSLPKPSDEIKADPEAFARRSLVARVENGAKEEKESALVALVAERALRHGPRPDAVRTLARIGLELGLPAVDAKQIIKKGEALAERVRGTVIEKAAQEGAVGTAAALLAREADIDRLVAGAAGAGGRLVKAGEGRIKNLLDREIEKTVRSFNAATLADVERDTGIDIAGEILANSPEKFDPSSARRASEGKPKGAEVEGDDGSASASSPAGEANLTDYEIARRQRVRKDAEERVAKMIATAKERSEAAKKEREEWEAKREERKRRAEEAAASGEDGGGESGEGGGEGAAPGDRPKLSTFADFKTPEEFAAFFRVWAEDRYKKEHGASTLGKHEEKRLFPEFYRKAVVRELQDLADKLLPPKGARATVNRWLGEIQPGVRPDTLERISADVFAFINRNAIRESRTEMVRKFRKELKPFAAGAKFEELKMDSDRKVSGWAEEAARYIRRVCELSDREINGRPSQLAEERARLQEILDRREKVYDDEGRDAADAPKSDMETRRALAKLQLLEKYGAMKRLMPGEIADLAEEAVRWLNDEAGKLEEAWRGAREAEEGIRAALVGGIVGPDGGKYARAKGFWGAADRLFDSMNGMIRLRLQHLVRFADGAGQQKAKDAINRVVVMLGDGETAFARHLQDDRAAFHDALARIFARPEGGGVDRRALADWLNRMTEEIPKELSRRLSKQGYGESMTYGQMLQLLVSLEQRSYAEAIEANGRAGQAELIRTFEAAGPDGVRERVLTDRDLLFIDWLRSFYEAKRGMLSEVTKRMTGLPIDSPDPNYCPVKMYTGDKARGMHVDSSAAWDPIGAVFTRRIRNRRDFDESASILGQFFDRSAEAAKLVAWGERGSIIRGVFTDASVQESVRRAFGGGELSKILKQLEETFNGGEGVRKAPGEIAAMDKAMNWMTYLSLGYNPLSAAKQTTSFTVWANALPGGFKDLWRYMTDVDMETIRHIRESDEYKVRYGNEVGSGHDVATKGVFENPSENPLAAFFRKTSMGLLRKGDFLPGGWIAQGLFRDLYNRHLKEGMDAAAADRLAMTETFNMLEETQQSGRTYNTQELVREHGRLGRLLVQFATSPLQQLQWETQAAREVMDLRRYRPAAPDADFEKRYSEAKGRFIRAAVINHVLLPAALHAVTDIYRLAMGQEPEWEKEGWHWSMLRDVVMGQASRITFLGTLGTTLWDAAVTGKVSFSQTDILPVEGLIRSAGQVGKTGRDLVVETWRGMTARDFAESFDYEKVQKDLDRLLRSSSVTRTPYDVVRRVTGNSDADVKKGR